MESLVEHAQRLQLSQHPVWFKLLHYESIGLLGRGVKSAILDDEFFTHSQGKIDPEKELASAVTSILNSEINVPDQHFICRFPARYKWLKSQIDLSSTPLEVTDCPRFNEWTRGNQVKSISVVYVTGYLSNPATYYGHILLKFNFPKSTGQPSLLDQTINYGVIFPEAEDPVSYIVNSLVGGYDGGFSQAQYHHHTRNYGELELRDLWEYELNLSQDEVDLIVAHSWELQQKRYKYYFFDKNCAYRLAEIFDVIEGFSINPSNPVFVVPQAVIQKIAATSRNGNPLMSKVMYRPSRQTRFYGHYNQLKPLEQAFLQSTLLNSELLESDQFIAFSLASKQLILDTLIDYYQFAEKAEALDAKKIEENYRLVLAKRYQLPAGYKATPKPKRYVPPHAGRKPSHIKIEQVHNNDLGGMISMSIRPAYYDALDGEAGHVSHSALSMGETGFVIKDNQLRLRMINLFKLESVNKGITGLPGDDGDAWKISLSASQKHLACLDCLALKFEGDYGWSFRPQEHLMVGAFVGGGLQDNRQGSGNILVKGSIFAHLNLPVTWNAKLEIELPKQIDGSGGGENRMHFELRKKLGTNFDMRFFVRKKSAAETAVAIGYYF